jgi:hypothetical protein
VLKEDDTFTAEAAGEKDKDCTGGEGLTWSGGVDRFADLEWKD